jgi:hypothetical protein
MTPLELCEQLGGYASAHKLRVRHNGKQVYIGTLVGDSYELNALGKQLMAEFNAKQVVGISVSEPEPEVDALDELSDALGLDE